jgi:SAM-dependent methyltransferase
LLGGRVRAQRGTKDGEDETLPRCGTARRKRGAKLAEFAIPPGLISGAAFRQDATAGSRQDQRTVFRGCNPRPRVKPARCKDRAGFRMADPMQATRRFSDRVADYVRYRPGYPHEIVATLAAECELTPASVIADVGCGPGNLARVFLNNGNRVIGVEPNAPMREAGVRAMAGARFEAVEGSAEATGLETGSVDFVTAGQAFHWFEPAGTRAEFVRILRPGGWCLLVWNEHHRKSAFLDEYDGLLRRHGTDCAEVRGKTQRRARSAEILRTAAGCSAGVHLRSAFRFRGTARAARVVVICAARRKSGVRADDFGVARFVRLVRAEWPGGVRVRNVSLFRQVGLTNITSCRFRHSLQSLLAHDMHYAPREEQGRSAAHGPGRSVKRPTSDRPRGRRTGDGGRIHPHPRAQRGSPGRSHLREARRQRNRIAVLCRSARSRSGHSGQCHPVRRPQS